MRKFNTPREARTTRVILHDIHHRINRRAMLFSMLNEEWELYRETNNWMIEDQHLNNIHKLKEALDELMRAKVGDELTYCVIY